MAREDEVKAFIEKMRNTLKEIDKVAMEEDFKRNEEIIEKWEEKWAEMTQKS